MQQTTGFLAILPDRKQTIYGVCIFIGLYFLAKENYLFFHTIAESIEILVSVLVYVLGAKTYRFSKDNYLNLLGVILLFISVLNFFHMITYYGMGVFPALKENRALQFWIASQYLEALSLLTAAIFARSRLFRNTLTIILGAVTLGLIIIILPLHLFPVCYIPGVGLSKFKVYSEYLISIIYFCTLIVMHLKRNSISIYVYRTVVLYIVLKIVAELMLTLYIDVYGDINFFSHCILLIAEYLIYQGIVAQGLVSPHKTIFQELKDSNEKLLEANTYKSVFLASVGHELRTPLTGILGLCEELVSEKYGQLTYRQKDYLEDIDTSGRELLRLINNLLDLTKIESGKESWTLSEVQVAQVLEEEVKKLKRIASQRNIQITVSAETLRIFADEDKFRQVVQNLLGNAIKFSSIDGQVTVSLYPTDIPGEGMICEFRDLGIGIPDEEQSKIFEPFYKVDTKTNRKYAGTGLGLALVKKIVDFHQGKIWVQSQLGKGSTFKIYLPKYPIIDRELE